MRKWLLLLLIIPIVSGCTVRDTTYDQLSVFDDHFMVDNEWEALLVNKDTGATRSYFMPLSGTFHLHEDRILIAPGPCREPHATMKLMDFRGNILGHFDPDGPLHAWANGFSTTSAWNWNGAFMEAMVPPVGWNWMISDEGHVTSIDEVKFLLANGETTHAPGWIQAISPDGNTILVQSWKTNLGLVRGTHNWNISMPVASQDGYAFTDTHIGFVNGLRMNLATGEIDALPVDGLRNVDAHRGLFWVGHEYVVSEAEAWRKTGETWAQETHPGWTPTGSAQPYTPPTPEPSQDQEAPLPLFLAFVAIFLARKL